MGTNRTRRLASVVTVVVALAFMAGLTSCDPPPDTYVSLGDSYVAGPFIPIQRTDPIGCLRSTNNYPSLVSSRIKVTQFIDPSCSGATTTDFSAAQSTYAGPANPPQYDSLSNRDKVVTVGIGGNDIGFTSIIETCAAQNPLGPGCESTYVHDGHDDLRDKIDATAPKIAAVLAEVHRRAPRAKVFLVGYPTVIPETGNGCYPVMPVLPSDTPYLRGVAKYLNAMLAGQANVGGATYVDTATSSIGHDYCALDKWVEGLAPTGAAAPVHPNAKGMANTATVVAASINAAVPN